MFCFVENSENEGLGKVIYTDGKQVTVEYFDCPGKDGRHCVDVALSSIKPKRLGRNTRVYTCDATANQWRIGRVFEDDGEGIEIRLADKYDVYLPYDQIFVRWNHPIHDPVFFLGQFITETPRYAESRSAFLSNYLNQRSSASGISGLLSSSIDLESHQVDVVRRVLKDHTQRYLLADEVGLGKTIEAGVIIRQTVLDDLWGHRILVLAPSTLVGQWKNELRTRFGLNDYIDKSLLVLPLSDTSEVHKALTHLSLLVIDEAHHLADARADGAPRKLYDRVCTAARHIDRLLLLSATPILRNEEGFHRMLSLLDPVVYRPEDIVGFKTRIEHRQALAETVAALHPGNALFMDAPLADLIERFPDDLRLVQLTEALQAKLLDWPEEDDPEFCAAVRELRAHISETYRLNRRILRNRRSQVRGLTPDRAGVKACFIEDSSMSYLEGALDTWRIEASLAQSGEAAFSDFYWRMVEALLEEPSAIPSLCAQRLQTIQSGETPSFDEETERLEAMRQAYQGGWLDARLDRLSQCLKALPNDTKAVIFCSTISTADQVFSHLQVQQLGVARHLAPDNFAIDPDSPAWQAFMDIDNSAVRFLVCDRHAEEGINLQGGKKVVVHFDLPLQPNRIEQRMGRFDRFGHSEPIKSCVLIDQGSGMQQAWFEVLDHGLGVFNRSISSLQYLVEDELTKLGKDLLSGGLEAVQALRDRLGGDGGMAATELRLIDHQDALDQLSPLPEEDLNELFDTDMNWHGIRSAMMPWILDSLLFEAVPNAAMLDEKPFRLRYLNPDNSQNEQRTLIPSSLFIDNFLGVIDPAAPGGNAARPLSYPYVSRRGMAVRRQVRPFRYGSEFIEAVRSFSELDDRGRSYAMWRQVFNFPFPKIKICFRFDFVVEACLSKAFGVLSKYPDQSSPTSRSGLARRAVSLFGPTVMQVWIDSEGREFDKEFVEKYLTLRYKKAPGGNGYVDKNLETPLMNVLRNRAPRTFENWAIRCERMSDKAKDIVLARPELHERQNQSLKRALAEDEVRYAQLQTRIRCLQGIEQEDEGRQFQLEQDLSEALNRGIRSPQVKVDVAGVVFLTSEPAPIA